jgi:aspartyl-tRNA(Asn)/glutamyl-tRNA(Gln) amidotransferase subunit A
VSNPTLNQLATDLDSGRLTSRALVEQSLELILDPAGEGSRAFICVDVEAARATADYQDLLRKAGYAPSRFAGVPFSVKDLFDVAGQVTTAGSKVLKDALPAKGDADAIAALKAAGFVALGRTNMTEFAYSGVGLNPHYGTPRSPFQRDVGRIPGGSSSGAAVAVADGMCSLSIGTDTGGSCRIPAAYNGIVGFKPSAQRVSKRGAYPLSSSFDSVGPLANSVACCAAADAIMAGDWDGIIASGPSRHARFGVLRRVAMDGLDPEVEADFERKLAAMRAGGAVIENVIFEALREMPALLKRGGIVGAEASYVHRDSLALRGHEYDPRVCSRINMALETSAADYLHLLKKRADFIEEFERLAAGFDAILLPTVANIAPKISDLASDEDYLRLNGLSLRNTYFGNFLNGCAISLPMHRASEAPTGLMVMAPNGSDRRLFSIANSIN